jgi:hypothetical protein
MHALTACSSRVCTRTTVACSQPWDVLAADVLFKPPVFSS